MARGPGVPQLALVSIVRCHRGRWPSRRYWHVQVVSSAGRLPLLSGAA